MKDKPNKIEKRSKFTVTLWKNETTIEVDEDDLLIDDVGVPLLALTVEERAVHCPFCDNTTKMLLVNGSIVKGGGCGTRIQGNQVSDCCGRPMCSFLQDAWHGEHREKGQ